MLIRRTFVRDQIDLRFHCELMNDMLIPFIVKTADEPLISLHCKHAIIN
jgi:hypothetical protein